MTDEQLARFACVCVFGTVEEFRLRTVVELFEASPIVRDVWLGRHAEFQRRAYEIVEGGEGS